MSRIVVFEVPDKSDVTMRQMLHKVKELDDSIEARMSMPFSHWKEMLSEISPASLPIFLPTGANLNDLVNFIQKARVTPIEERE